MTAPPRPDAPRPQVHALAGPRSLAAGTTSLRLPGEHFAASAVFLACGALGLVWISPLLAQGLYQSPHVVAVTHLFTLGWLTTTIFGAMYQLVPVALGAEIRSERLGHAAFGAHVCGVALMVAGVGSVRATIIHAAVGFLTLGICGEVLNIGLSLRSAVRRDIVLRAIQIALTCLVITLAIGALLAVSFTTGLLGRLRLHVTALHLHVALIGWVLMTIVGVSHRLLPMFLLAHGANERWTARAVSALAIGIVLLAAGFATGSTVVLWLALAGLEIGLGCFLGQAWIFLRARKRPRLDAGIEHAATALVFLAAAGLLAPVVLVLGASRPRLAVTYLIVGLLGGLSLYVIGQFYKIVPFLTWIARYRDKVGRGTVPAVADLYSARVARLDLVAYASGVPIMALGTVTGQALIVRGGTALVAIGVLCLMGQLIRIRWRHPQ